MLSAKGKEGELVDVVSCAGDLNEICCTSCSTSLSDCIFYLRQEFFVIPKGKDRHADIFDLGFSCAWRILPRRRESFCMRRFTSNFCFARDSSLGTASHSNVIAFFLPSYKHRL